MRVLFVSSGKAGDVGVVVRNQGESLKRIGVDIDFYTIKPGLWGYLMAIFKLRRVFYKGNYNLVHAHYGLSAISASFAGRFPLVVSIMGSDAHLFWPIRFLFKTLSKLRWQALIVKTLEIKSILNLSQAKIIPNGVDTDRFKPADKSYSRKDLNLEETSKIILFISTRGRPEKNLALATKAVAALNNPNIKLLHLHSTPNSEIPGYLNAADLLLLTSSREGSVNVIKEAMSCNCPIVATDVGDVSWILGPTKNCFIADSNENDLARKINMVLEDGERSNGRQRILELDLDAIEIAKRIKVIYHEVLEK